MRSITYAIIEFIMSSIMFSIMGFVTEVIMIWRRTGVLRGI